MKQRCYRLYSDRDSMRIIVGIDTRHNNYDALDEDDDDDDDAGA